MNVLFLNTEYNEFTVITLLLLGFRTMAYLHFIYIGDDDSIHEGSDYHNIYKHWVEKNGERQQNQY